MAPDHDLLPTQTIVYIISAATEWTDQDSAGLNLASVQKEQEVPSPSSIVAAKCSAEKADVKESYTVELKTVQRFVRPAIKL